MHELEQFQIIQSLAKKQKASVYLVGGFLRDLVIGKRKLDFDFAVSKGALKLAKVFANKIKGAYVLLDAERGCARVVKKSHDSIVTFDFSDFRAKTLKQDLALRDFTVNTLYVPLAEIASGKDLKALIHDEKGGLQDIKAKRIKMVSAKAFRDDPLRILRAFSLRAIYNFKIDKAAIVQAKKDKALLHNVSAERVRDEFFKILGSKNAYATLVEMDKAKVLDAVIPQLQVMYGCTQGGYHHLDVWKHTLEVVKQLEGVFEQFHADQEVIEYVSKHLAGERTRAALMKLGALLHDIGKPDTKTKEGDRFRFNGHERVGRDITRPIAKMLKLSTHERYILEDMVFMHLRPGYLSNFDCPSERMIFRFFRDAKEEAVSILLLSLADQRATRGPLTTEKDQKHHEEICVSLTKRYFEKLKEKPVVRLINGNDIMKALKIKPSPLVGKILAKLEEQQALGKINSRREALELVKANAEK